MNCIRRERDRSLDPLVPVFPHVLTSCFPKGSRSEMAPKRGGTCVGCGVEFRDLSRHRCASVEAPQGRAEDVEAVDGAMVVLPPEASYKATESATVVTTTQQAVMVHELDQDAVATRRLAAAVATLIGSPGAPRLHPNLMSCLRADLLAVTPAAIAAVSAAVASWSVGQRELVALLAKGQLDTMPAAVCKVAYDLVVPVAVAYLNEEANRNGIPFPAAAVARVMQDPDSFSKLREICAAARIATGTTTSTTATTTATTVTVGPSTDKKRSRGPAVRFGGKCFSCGKAGHKETECRSKKKTEK